MVIHVYKAKRDPLKSVPLEKPDMYCVGGNMSTSCREARQTTHVTDVPFQKHLFKTKCTPSCVKEATPGGTLPRPLYCTGESVTTECKSSSRTVLF